MTQRKYGKEAACRPARSCLTLGYYFLKLIEIPFHLPLAQKRVMTVQNPHQIFHIPSTQYKLHHTNSPSLIHMRARACVFYRVLTYTRMRSEWKNIRNLSSTRSVTNQLELGVFPKINTTNDAWICLPVSYFKILFQKLKTLIFIFGGDVIISVAARKLSVGLRILRRRSGPLSSHRAGKTLLWIQYNPHTPKTKEQTSNPLSSLC